MTIISIIFSNFVMRIRLDDYTLPLAFVHRALSVVLCVARRGVAWCLLASLTARMWRGPRRRAVAITLYPSPLRLILSFAATKL